MTRPRAVVLLSGGMDSATTLAVARRDGHDCYALSFRYGQRHAVELEAARHVAASLGALAHQVLDINLRAFGGSALTSDLSVPKDRALDAMSDAVPVTYVPARNTVFLALALAWSEVLEARAIYIGANAIDYSGYPDCRPEFLEAFEEVARRGTRAGIEGHGVEIRAPLVHLTKAGIIRLGRELGVDYSLTRTCYDPSPEGAACGHCDACLLRLKGFAELGLTDPAPYRQAVAS